MLSRCREEFLGGSARESADSLEACQVLSYRLPDANEAAAYVRCTSLNRLVTRVRAAAELRLSITSVSFLARGEIEPGRRESVRARAGKKIDGDRGREGEHTVRVIVHYANVYTVYLHMQMCASR